MATYNLQQNEAVLLKEESVAHGGSFASYTDELILTNLNLVLIKKGLFGKGKGIHVFPLNQIKVYNGEAQALVAKKSNGLPALEVYFLNGQEMFVFQTGGKKKVPEWVSKINLAVTGEDSSALESKGMAIPGAGMVAGMLKDTYGVFKAKLGSGTDSLVKIAGKCTACGAPLSGTRGSTITCDYCGTAAQL